FSAKLVVSCDRTWRQKKLIRASSVQPHLTPEAYLEAEKSSPIKHEYINGQIYDMAGASDAHVTLMLNLALILKNHLQGTGCRVYASDMKARIDLLNIFYYPDILVTCDARDREFEYFKRYPCLIIEVLSNSTEAFDSLSETLRERGDKFMDYREIDTLQEYVLVNQKRQQIECFRRNCEGQWVLYVYRGNREFELTSIDFTGSISQLYADVIFPPIQ
ncbi:MAG: Uma2 family endonuclease, partial [Geitlerinemataceae cyanobacterium]